MKNVKLLLLFLILPLFIFSQSYQLDQSFGEDGLTKIDFHEGGELVWSGKWMNSNNLLVSGCVSADVGLADYNILMASYNENGRLNEDYGNNGWLNIDLGTEMEDPYDQLSLPDGSLLLAGSSHGGGFIVKISPEGIIDESFADGKGNTFYQTSVTGSGSIQQIRIQSDGKIIGLTNALNIETGVFEKVLIRYTSEGIWDETFADNGILFAPSNYISSFEIDKDDNIYVGSSFDKYLEVVRLLPNGDIDPSFADQGFFAHRLDKEGVIYSFEILEDGNILIVGHEGASYSNGNAILLRINDLGELDPSFGVDGKASTGNTEGNFLNHRIVVLKDGRIMMGGAYYKAGSGDPAIFLTEFSKDGQWEAYSAEEDFLMASAGNHEHFTTDLFVDENENIFQTYISFEDLEFSGVAKFTSSTVGVKDLDLDLKTQLSPNPASSTSTLSYRLSSDRELSIALIDASGKMIQSIRPASKQISGKHQQEISLSPTLDSGVYFIQLKTEKGVKAIPLSVQ